jgi:hypothetical protein
MALSNCDAIAAKILFVLVVFLASCDRTCKCCINYVERFYSTHLTTGVARDTRSGKFDRIPRTTSSLSRCVANSIETATQRHWMPNCQNCLGRYLSAIFRLQKIQQFFFHSSKIRPIYLPQRLQQTFDCLLQRIGIHSRKA